jgi:hypothetical protein
MVVYALDMETVEGGLGKTRKDFSEFTTSANLMQDILLRQTAFENEYMSKLHSTKIPSIAKLEVPLSMVPESLSAPKSSYSYARKLSMMNVQHFAETENSIIIPVTEEGYQKVGLEETKKSPHDQMLEEIIKSEVTTIEDIRQKIKDYIGKWSGQFLDCGIELDFSTNKRLHRQSDHLQSLRLRVIAGISYLFLALLYDNVITRVSPIYQTAAIVFFGTYILEMVLSFRVYRRIKSEGEDKSLENERRRKFIRERLRFAISSSTMYLFGWAIMTFSSYGQVTYAPLEILIVTILYSNTLACPNTHYIIKNAYLWIWTIVVIVHQYLSNNLHPIHLTALSVFCIQVTLTVDDYEKTLLLKVDYIMEKLSTHSQQQNDQGG